MRRQYGAVLMMASLALASACTSGRDNAVSAATAAAAQAETFASVAAPGMEHGDHNPHHGGTVYMYDDMHYEVVLDPGGQHRVYFTDSVREDLPASVAASVTLTVERPGGTPEALHGVIDPQGESWLLAGTPITQKDTSVRVAFTAKGSEYWIDVPFIATAQ